MDSPIYDSDNKNLNLHDYFQSSTSDSIFDNKYIQNLVEDKMKETDNYSKKVHSRRQREKQSKYVKMPYGEHTVLGSKYQGNPKNKKNSRKRRKIIDNLSDENKPTNKDSRFENPDSSFDWDK